MNEICLSCKKHTKCGRAKHETIGCGYYVPLTEQEYLQTCNTEQLANVFFNYRYINATPQQQLWMSANEEFVKNGIVEWLKQPHTKGDSE